MVRIQRPWSVDRPLNWLQCLWEKKIIILINLPVEFLKIQGHGWKVHIFPVAGCQMLKTEVNMKQSQRDWLQHRKFRPSLYNSMETAWNSAHQLNTSRLGLLHLCDITTFVSPWSLLMAGKWPYCHLSLSLVQLLFDTHYMAKSQWTPFPIIGFSSFST